MNMSRPLSPEAAAVINEFKRSGQFDNLRKSLFQEFKESVSLYYSYYFKQWYFIFFLYAFLTLFFIVNI